MQMRIRNRNRKSTYLILVWIIMAVSGIVFIEPAPVDIGIVLLLCLGVAFRKIKFNDDIQRGLVLLFFFLITNILSLLFARGFLFGLRYFMITAYLVLSLIFFVGIVNHYGQKAVEVLFSGYVVAAVASSLLSLGVYFSLLPEFAEILKYGRMTGLFKDPNVFGPFMIPPALYAMSRMEKGKKRLLWAGVLILTSLAILLSYSRAAWGGYALALVIYLVFRFVKRPTLNQIVRAIVLLALVAALILYMLRIPSIRAALENRFSLQSYDSERFSKQMEAIRMSRNYPLGAGPGQTGNVINYSTHNSYIMILLENGLLGMLSYVLFLIYSLWLSFKKARKTNNAIYIISFATILSTMGISLVIDVVHWRHWWFVLAIPWFSYMHVKRKAWQPAYAAGSIYSYVTEQAAEGSPQDPDTALQAFSEEEKEAAHTGISPSEPVNEVAAIRHIGKSQEKEAGKALVSGSGLDGETRDIKRPFSAFEVINGPQETDANQETDEPQKIAILQEAKKIQEAAPPQKSPALQEASELQETDLLQETTGSQGVTESSELDIPPRRKPKMAYKEPRKEQ